MSEYKTFLAKQPLGGFAQNPEQTISNSGNPLLDTQLKAKDALGGAVAYSYGKRVAGTIYNAIVEQTGNSRLEEGLAIAGRLAGYGGLAIVGTPILAAGAAGVDFVINQVGYSVEAHNESIESEKTIKARGSLVTFGGGGYYG